MYRRLTLMRSALRLRVILGSSGELAEHQLLVRMMALQFLWWTLPSVPLRLVTESKAQFELVFTLSPLAAWTMHLMRRLYRRTGLEVFVPQVRILRDPDWCTNSQFQSLNFRLYEREVEYQEPFAVAKAQQPTPAPSVQPARVPHPQAQLSLVVDNAPVLERATREVDWDAIPATFRLVPELDGDRTEVLPRPPERPATDGGHIQRPTPRRI